MQLETILQQELEAVKRFIDVLEQEQRALRAAEADRLQAIDLEKTKVIDELNRLSALRMTQLGKASATDEKEAMAHWLSQQDGKTQAAQLWSSLLEQARTAKRINELNAQLVNIHLTRTANALAILNRRAQENTLYGSNGQAAQFTGSRIVDSA